MNKENLNFSDIEIQKLHYQKKPDLDRWCRYW